MTEPLICIKAKAQSGRVQEFRVVEILEIDGEPYVKQDWKDQLAAAIAELQGRVERLETQNG